VRKGGSRSLGKRSHEGSAHIEVRVATEGDWPVTSAKPEVEGQGLQEEGRRRVKSGRADCQKQCTAAALSSRRCNVSTVGFSHAVNKGAIVQRAFNRERLASEAKNSC